MLGSCAEFIFRKLEGHAFKCSIDAIGTTAENHQGIRRAIPVVKANPVIVERVSVQRSLGATQRDWRPHCPRRGRSRDWSLLLIEEKNRGILVHYLVPRHNIGRIAVILKNFRKFPERR